MFGGLRATFPVARGIYPGDDPGPPGAGFAREGRASRKPCRD